MNEVIKKELDTKAIIIYGKQRNGKTLLGIRLALDYTRIYANVTILREGAPIETHINRISDLSKIPLTMERGVVLIDEASRIYGARSSLSQANKTVNDFLFLVGKKNCDLIWIAQIEESIDKYARKLTEGSIEIRKWHTEEELAQPKIFFTLTVRKNDEIIKVYNYDLLRYMASNGIEYYTTEEGGIEHDKYIGEKTKKRGVKSQ